MKNSLQTIKNDFPHNVKKKNKLKKQLKIDDLNTFQIKKSPKKKSENYKVLQNLNPSPKSKKFTPKSTVSVPNYKQIFDSLAELKSLPLLNQEDLQISNFTKVFKDNYVKDKKQEKQQLLKEYSKKQYFDKLELKLQKSKAFKNRKRNMVKNIKDPDKQLLQGDYSSSDQDLNLEDYAKLALESIHTPMAKHENEINGQFVSAFKFTAQDVKKEEKRDSLKKHVKYQQYSQFSDDLAVSENLTTPDKDKEESGIREQRAFRIFKMALRKIKTKQEEGFLKEEDSDNKIKTQKNQHEKISRQNNFSNFIQKQIESLEKLKLKNNERGQNTHQKASISVIQQYIDLSKENEEITSECQLKKKLSLLESNILTLTLEKLRKNSKIINQG